MRQSSVLASIALFVAVSLLSSCKAEPAIESELNEYLQRLDNTLTTDKPTAPFPSRSTYPAKAISIASSKITVLDFLRLFGCELQYTIGQRNSQLGKVATDSQRLINTIRFLRHAPQCITQLDQANKTQLANKLRAASALKQTQIAALIYNATLAGPEFTEMWQAQIPTDYPTRTNTSIASALEKLTITISAWLQGDYGAGDLEFENTLKTIRAGDAGALYEAFKLSKHQFALANDLLNASQKRQSLCPLGRPNRQSKTLETVVQKFFVQKIQTRQAQLNQRYQLLMPPIVAIEQALEPDLPYDYQEWRDLRDESLAKALESPKAHVTLIKKTLENCNSSLGGK